MKKYIVMAAMAVASLAVMAQESCSPASMHHFVQFNLGFGAHSLLYKLNPETGKTVGGPGALLEARYQYMFNEHWGIGAGLGLSSMNSRARLNDFVTPTSYVHPENGETFNYVISPSKESQNMLQLDIPIQAYYMHSFTDRWHLLSSAGFIIHAPVWAAFSTKGDMAGYFPSTGLTYHDLQGHGFGPLQDYRTNNGRIRMNANFGLQLDCGALYQLSDRLGLYMGVYLNTDFVNGLKQKDESGSIVDREVYQLENGVYSYNGILATYDVQKVTPFEFGVKGGVRLGFKSKEQSAAERNLRTLLTMATFQSNSSAPIFAADAEDSFGALRAYIKKHPKATIVVTGHTDNVGTEEANEKLGMQRAEAFRDALVAHDIPAANIKCVSKGSKEPVADNATAEGRARNRRVELMLK